MNEGTVDQEFTVHNSGSYLAANENLVKVKTSARFINERIDREMGTIVDTVENRIQNAILTTIFSIISPKIELAIKSINAFSGQDATSDNSGRGEHKGLLLLLNTYPKGIIQYIC